MKRRGLIFIALINVILVLTGCSSQSSESAEGFSQFEFTHYSSGGTTETFPAIILMEESNSTFTAYQVAFMSCNCRDTMDNYYTIAYVELLNSRPSADEAAIRSISLGNNRGLYGDSNPNYYKLEYTEEHMDEHFVQNLVQLTRTDIDAWEGYGKQVEGVDADALAGASVTTSNVTSMLQGLFDYHADKYY